MIQRGSQHPNCARSRTVKINAIEAELAALNLVCVVGDCLDLVDTANDPAALHFRGYTRAFMRSPWLTIAVAAGWTLTDIFSGPQSVSGWGPVAGLALTPALLQNDYALMHVDANVAIFTAEDGATLYLPRGAGSERPWWADFETALRLQ